jgi:hypothetical protein
MALAAVAITAGRPPRKKPPEVVIILKSGSMSISASSPAPGILAFTAQYSASSLIRDASMWPEAKVYRVYDTGRADELVWEHEYNDVAHCVPITEGMRTPGTVNDVIPLTEPGSYQIYFGVNGQRGKDASVMMDQVTHPVDILAPED